MNPRDRSSRFHRTCHLAIALILLVGLSTPLIGDDAQPTEKEVKKPAKSGPEATDKDTPKKPAKSGPDASAVEMHFRDDSKLKLTLREERIELVTPYGKLLIPAADIRQIEFGFHIDAETSKRVDAAIGNLGSSDFKEREAATATLLELGEKAYPALVLATKHSDMEIVRRAEEVLSKLRDKIPSEQLDRPLTDVVLTGDSKITGRIANDVFKVKTFQFGDQQVQLGDLRTMRAVGYVTDVAALPDPGSLMKYQEQIGKTFVFKVTGRVDGAVWGAGVYTPDSSLATAAVHAGAVKNGQTGSVKVMIVPGPPAYLGSTANGVTSQPWNGGFTGAFQVMLDR
jgi:hypothetical protein